MYYPALPNLLKRIKDIPTLLLWGKEDKIVPISAGEVYKTSIKESKLITFDDCGHHPELEKPNDFVNAVKEFFA